MNKYKKWLGYLALLIIQISIINNGVLGIKFSLLLGMTMLISERYGTISGNGAGLILGLGYDILLSSHIGITAIALFMVSIVVGKAREYIYSDSYTVLISYGLVTSIVYFTVINALNFILKNRVNIYMSRFLIQTVVDIVLLIIFIRVKPELENMVKIFKIER